MLQNASAKPCGDYVDTMAVEGLGGAVHLFCGWGDTREQGGMRQQRRSQ